MTVLDQQAVESFKLRVGAKKPAYVADNQLNEQVNNGFKRIGFLSRQHLLISDCVVKCESTLYRQ